jgi:hypothetical protein
MVMAFYAANALMVSLAEAVPKGPAGQMCKSSGTTTVNGKEEGTGKTMKCTADYCKYDECETSGPNVGKCYEKTSYSNVRDCKAAARSMNPNFQVPQSQLSPSTVQPSQPPSQRAPMAPKGGVMQRGVEAEEPTSSEKEGK